MSSESSSSATPSYAALCPQDALAPGQAKRFEVGERQIALARIADEFFAIDDICSHGHYSLSQGELDEFDCTLECPKHGSLFNLRTGEPETLPATVAVEVFPVRLHEGEVQIELAPASASAPAPAPASAPAPTPEETA